MTATPADDLGLLHRYLQAQRDHVLTMLDGLDDTDLRRPLLPSGWTCLMLVHHLTMGELLWLECVVGGDPDAIERLRNSVDWDVPDGVAAATVLAAYCDQIARSDAVIETATAATELAWWPDFFGAWRLDGVPQLMLHLITEVACHAGHLDVVRELIDGRQFMAIE